MVTSSSTPQRQPYTLPAAILARAHTVLAALAFSSALLIGSYLHYYKIVKNGVAAYPDEWFPSVSATIGDWYPERNIFQILIALTAGPRFALVLLQYYLHSNPTSSLPTLVFITGIIRTLSCGGWVYITSSDDHDVHDVMMILYMVCNIPWMLGGIASTPVKSMGVRRKRTYIATAFFTTIVPLVYYFIQHKVHRIPGAYTRYAFFEWGLIFFDVFYDSVTEQEFRESNLQLALGPSLSSTTTTDQIVNMNIITVSDDKTSADILKAATDKALMGATNGALAPATVLPTNEEIDWTGFRQPLSFISDVYLSYLFFTLFTSLIPTLFYFSVWELGIAGQELFLFTTLSPFLLGIPQLYRFVKTRNGRVLFHLLSFVGLGAYVLEKPLDRLFVVGGANVIAVLRQAAEWSSAEEVGYQAIVASLGFMVSSLSKHANHSNNPVWPFINAKTGGYNKTGLTLGVLAVLELYFRRSPSQLPSIKTSTSTPTSLPSRPPWITASLSLGSLLFSLHNLLSEPSTLIAWSWTGYENGRPRGPVPHIHGSLTLVLQSLGLLLPIILSSPFPSSSTYKRLSFNPLASPLWFIYGSASAYAMYTYRNWPGYAGGLAHAMFLMSITPLVFQRAAAAGKVARTYGVAFLVYCLFNLASIFTAAYAFVPGGQIFRERTDLVTIAQLACLSLAFRWPALSPSTLPPTPTLPRSSASHAKYLLSLISILAVLTSMYRTPSTPPQPFKPGPRIVNAGIWTIHFGIDNEGHDSQRGVRNLIRDMELDIVGLLETDLHRTAFGHRDLTRVIVEDMGYNVDIGPGPNSHTWGCVLLTKFPIINTTHHLLPSPHGELAPAIEAVLDIYGTEVTVVVSHNGQEDPLDRELQSIKLAQIMSEAYPRPVIFLGYVVTKPHANRPNPYEIMVTDGRVFDIEVYDFDRWCEYIFFRGLYRTAYVRISRGIITDTEMQIGQFVVPKYGANITDDSVASYSRVSEEEMPKEHVFPYQYYGNDWVGGVDKHYYHVFGEPLYYKIPENAVL
ncbi:Frag1/DRAM/Sfk1 family-domain-containing protein [Crucibulum laeve]|uniref:Frag1/DRAM/Sfk1 family-domain-containing protein n=1 Tax=Crucibulum laeve TaxID=68775 RepID=A0A5C3M6P9_9AGAR|nr:Frag1/DRAM/Sfk1 family-domain-containing protein [Crucibulum laeve]